MNSAEPIIGAASAAAYLELPQHLVDEMFAFLASVNRMDLARLRDGVPYWRNGHLLHLWWIKVGHLKNMVADFRFGEFPRGFRGVVDLRGQIVSTDKPEHAPPPDHVYARSVFVWRLQNYFDLGGTYDIWADYKGRGFWMVDASTNEDISGPIRADWRLLPVVLGAAAAVFSTRDKLAKESKE